MKGKRDRLTGHTRKSEGAEGWKEGLSDNRKAEEAYEWKRDWLIIGKQKRLMEGRGTG